MLYIYIHIYRVESVCPLFWWFNHPKEGLFQSKLRVIWVHLRRQIVKKNLLKQQTQIQKSSCQTSGSTGKSCFFLGIPLYIGMFTNSATFNQKKTSQADHFCGKEQKHLTQWQNSRKNKKQQQKTTSHGRFVKIRLFAMICFETYPSSADHHVCSPTVCLGNWGDQI